MRCWRIACGFATIIFLSFCRPMQNTAIVKPILQQQPEKPFRGSYPKTTDILNTKLELSFNWDSAFVIGKAYIKAKPYFYPSNQVILDAQGFRINQVAMIRDQRKLPLNYSYDGKAIAIQLDKVYSNNENYTIFVDYVAMPNKLKTGVDINSADSRGLYFINPTGKDKDVPRQLWSQGESECNSTWFPTINGPQEKMEQEISLTVPDAMKTLSNGLLRQSSENSDGTRTDTWRLEKPHSTYLTMIAAGDFVKTTDTWRNKEVSYYMEPKFAANARLIFGKTPEMMEFFSKKLSLEYPWEKYSQIVVRDFVSGAMENTTATVLFDRMNMTEGEYLDENYEEIISHELFHHWFGDYVTAESWANLPLNESFAAYGEYLWNEYKYGRDYADYYGLKDQQAYLSNPQNHLKDVIRYHYEHQDEMFDNVTYEKGARILHMLRKTVGDDAFFKALNLYLTRYAYQTAEIDDLRLVFEEVTGQDLHWFFNQWFLASGHPKLNIASHYDEASSQVKVTISQLQDLSTTPLYKLPMAIDIYTGTKPDRKQIVLEKQEQTFTFPVHQRPKLVNVDAEKYLLCEKTEEKSLSEYVFQYEFAPLFLDRLEAINFFKKNSGEKAARQEMVKALGDQNWYIRKLAVDFVPLLSVEQRNSVYERLKVMAVSDERSYVRAAAIAILKRLFKNQDNSEVLEKASKDKAPSVMKALSGW
jgi:aminopeptidase N